MTMELKRKNYIGNFIYKMNEVACVIVSLVQLHVIGVLQFDNYVTLEIVVFSRAALVPPLSQHSNKT